MTTTRLVCPDALGGLLPPLPTPAAGAIIRANPEGDAYLDARIERGDAAVRIVEDSRAECRAAGVSP